MLCMDGSGGCVCEVALAKDEGWCCRYGGGSVPLITMVVGFYLQ